MTAAVGRLRVPDIEQQLCVAAVFDDLGRHRFTLYEMPCPNCTRVLWGWTHGHVQPSGAKPASCPCGFRGELAAFENVRHCEAETTNMTQTRGTNPDLYTNRKPPKKPKKGY